jgi:two-component system, response regulator PdtaR
MGTHCHLVRIPTVASATMRNEFGCFEDWRNRGELTLVPSSITARRAFRRRLLEEFVSRPLVLVVEDEALIRMSAVYMLDEAGFDVVEAGSADEAIALLETNTRIRIVFTDIDLPGSMNGLRLAAAIRDRWPPIELVLTSGHIHVEEEDLPDRGLFLAKPYSAQQLTEAIRSFGQL